MDARRPIRSTAHPSANAPPRRPIFHAPSAPSRSNSRTTTSKAPPHIPIASEPTADLVERDASGAYKIMAPPTAMKLHLDALTPEDTQTEEEEQMIKLYGRKEYHWDQEAVLEEIQRALRRSLERKVGSLEADRWMFEGEGGRRGV